MDFHSGLRTGLLIAFSYLMLLKATINVGMTLRRAFMEPGGSWACSPKEPGDWMHFRPETRRLDGLSSRNPEAEWTFVLEPGGWMDFQGNLLVYLFDSKSPPSGRLSLIARILGSNRTVVLLHNPERTGRSFGNLEVPSYHEVVFRTQRSSKDPEVVWEPGGIGMFHSMLPADGCRGRSRSFSQQDPGGRCPARGLDDISQPASPRQDIAPVILLSQVLLRSGPCSNLGENKFPGDKPGPSKRFQVLDLLRDDLARFRTLVAFHRTSRLIHGACGLKNWHVSFDAPCVRVSLDGCRGRSRSFSQQEPGGRCPARGLDDISQPTSPRQDIAPVILLSQVHLRSGPCSNLGENKFPGDKPGPSKRFQVSLVGARPDGETFDASVGINIGLSVAGPLGLA
ncbi:hypothetical protein F2Q69_00042236 [Brassica cretica]|uniref:Uncharacterized protein n=1 Tax=Brassica cretica TaxID=69181 RepID=A0A8S9NGI8_BRACR|nr:hypothetical protein F2Q69_00042236 [Brassica cretica]